MSLNTDMPLYQGTKQLRARPMTKGEYNAYRGWQPPANEDMAEPGFLVEYQDGGKSNDSRHTGYISWSPADVFEKTYRPAETFQDRVKLEASELEERIDKLTTFLSTDTFHALPKEEQDCLTAQQAAMLDYFGCLVERIESF
jgi:hypothetical protein